MQLAMALAQAIGELERTDQDDRNAGETVRQEEQLERLIMGPGRIRAVDQEALVMIEDVGDHQPDEGEQQRFGRHAQSPRPGSRQSRHPHLSMR